MSGRKRILFYYDNPCSETAKGGTELATYRIAKALSGLHGWEVYNAWRKGGDKLPEGSIYKAGIKLPSTGGKFVKSLSTFLKNNEIDVAVNMGKFFRNRKIVKAIKQSGRDIKLIFMHHFAPGSERIKSLWSSNLDLLSIDPTNMLYFLRVSFYPLFRLNRTLSLPKKYKSVAKKADKIVLLSENYVKPFMKFGGIKDKWRDKFIAIPNIYPDELQEINEDKKKHVLILSRMDEIQKRISLALKIWKNIENDPDLKEWQLDIVGTGHNLKSLEKLSMKMRLQNVVFHGWGASRQFLDENSIFMMTSRYEGLSLSLLEATATGCVPIVFNSHASLPDVIDDRKNGIIVQSDGDIDEFTEELKSLMKDDVFRKELANAGFSRMSNFTETTVGKKWNDMLNSL